jgi:hypothetical protein
MVSMAYLCTGLFLGEQGRRFGVSDAEVGCPLDGALVRQ